MQRADPGKSRSANLPESFFGVVRLTRVRIRIRCRRFLRNGTLFVAGGCPPAILVLRQLAHLRALLCPGCMLAVAITHRRLGTGHQSWGLVGQGGCRGGSQKDCDSNRMGDSVRMKCHDSFWCGNKGGPIARRMGFFGIQVVAVLEPGCWAASPENPSRASL